MAESTKALVIVESPAKAKTISRFLGKGYTVKASRGHVRDLPKSQFGIDVEKDFRPKYITIRGRGEIIKELKDAARKVDRIYLAPDPDREGEAICWHLANVLDLPNKDHYRVEFNEITKGAITKAFKHPRAVDSDRVNAQQARRLLDRIVGYMLSPLLWRKIRPGLSAGRVQSVALRLITEREQEIRDFQPEEYWSLTARLKTRAGAAFEARYHGTEAGKVELKTEAEVKAVTDGVQGSSWIVAKVKTSERKRHPQPPFITSTLQQEASRQLGFTARRTMAVAQQLYEGLDLGTQGSTGLVTYIRTDSTRVSETAVAEVRSLIGTKYGKDYLPEAPRTYKSRKTAQDAHEAIRPTTVLRFPEEVKPHLTRDQYRLYRLVWDRFVASQMESAVLDLVTADIQAREAIFRASGSTVRFKGYLVVYVEGRDEGADDDEKKLPPLTEGDALALLGLDPAQHFTQPPPRYSDATLVKTLEEKGIGRPSTYAPIVETILERGYVIREEKRFVPTELGEVVVELLKEHFPSVIDVDFTARMENRLDDVEDGKQDWKDLLRDFYNPFAQLIDRAEEQIGKVEIAPEVTDEICEHCGRNLVVKHGRYGKFLACPGFPECRFTKPIVESVGVNCPDCGGDIVVRRSKKGRRFYGCANYPTCSFVSWNKPTGQKCPRCETFLVESAARGRKASLKCANSGCGYTTAPAGSAGSARSPGGARK